METIHAHGTPLAAYLEGGITYPQNIQESVDRADAEAGAGYLDPTSYDDPLTPDRSASDADISDNAQASFAPTARRRDYSSFINQLPKPSRPSHRAQSSITRIHNAWSRAVNSRLGRADNARFLEHFRYIIVASQLLNEYLDHGALPPPTAPGHSLDGPPDATSPLPTVTTSLYGAALTGALAFALVYLLHWARASRDASASKGRALLVLLIFLAVAFVGYGYVRRHWLKFLRRGAVTEVTALTADWQSFEVSASSALSLIQEVELVSRGYRLSTPLPPASRIEDQAVIRRCVRLRDSLHKAYASVIASCVDAQATLRGLADEDDLEKYFEVYDISLADARDAVDMDSLPALADDPESLKCLRVLSYRSSVLRRVVLSSLMALEADGGKPDFSRWRLATDVMRMVSQTVSPAAEKIQQCLKDMDAIPPPANLAPSKLPNGAAKEKLRGQVRKISMLSSGIKTLQAKMQILREESNRSIEQSEDLADLGPSLMSQYEAIGEDLKELMKAWEAGKATLQSNLTKQEHRISLASSLASSARSAVSSIGGLTAVEEDGGGPAAALKALTGGSVSNRSSMATTPSDEEVFEAIALPRQRSTLTREERILKMQEERERQATIRAKRDANTSMLRELESVINLRPKKNNTARITSI